jgi:DinB family protein
MTTLSQQIPVALEVGKIRTFASALDWPGWTRSGRDEAAALDALLAYGLRYQRALRPEQPGFHTPTNLDVFEITERLAGGSSTDFGVPGVPPAADAAPVDAAERERLQCILSACWKTFAELVASASDRPLRKGPRGGGRTVLQIADHVIESHYSYLRKIYWREPHEKVDDVSVMVEAIDHADEQALAFATSDEMPTAGPRGGALWKPRYFVRRAAWHILDHAWEIEDKLEP